MTQQDGREETSHWMSKSVGCSPSTTGSRGPGSRHLSYSHSVTTAMATVPTTLTVPTICQPRCALRSSLHPAQHTHTQQILHPPYLQNAPYCTRHRYISILIMPKPNCPAHCTKAVTLTVLTVPIVHALWCTCTGSIPAGRADRGHVSARWLNRRD